MTEEWIYRGIKVQVNKSLVQVGGVSYPVNGISGVSIEREFGLSVVLVPIFLLIAWLLGGGFKDEFTWIGIGLASIAAWWASRTPHSLMLQLASARIAAYKSNDLGEVSRIKQAIEKAVVARG